MSSTLENPATAIVVAAIDDPSKNITTVVLNQLQGLREKGNIVFPDDYSVENALKSAWFYIQNSDNKAKILACTRESQANALYDMCIQGMNVGKKQGYLIPYGDRLAFQRSYFGEEALAKRVRPGITLYYDVIYEGEAFATAKVMSRAGLVTTIAKHEQPFPRKSKNIAGAYCGTIDENGENLGITLMDMDQIRTSWKKSKNIGPTSFHNEQPDIACKRTVIRRHVNPIINSSDDAALRASVQRQELDTIEAEISEDAALNANKDVLTIPAIESGEPTNGKATEEVAAAVTEPKADGEEKPPY